MGIRNLILVLAALLLSAAAWGQSGDKFHEVKPGETKYGIARQYNISIETLEQYNPDIKEGLRSGTKLLIPGNLPPAQNNEALAQDSGYVYHKVEMGHTLYSLARDYGSSVAAIKQANPQLGNDLKVGQKIKIPLNLPSASEPDPANFYLHKVQPQETAYSLSRLYKLSLDSLYALNPEAREGLSIGQKLRIPKDHVPQQAVKQQKELLKKENVKTKPEAQLATDETETRPLNDDYFLYKVKTGDSFYSFKQKYQVERNELLRLNPELSDGLKVGTYIIMPRRVKQEEMGWLEKLFRSEQPEKVPGPVSRETNQAKDSLNQPVVLEKPSPVFMDTVKVDINKNYRVALMLPFESDKLDSMDHYDLSISSTSEMAVQFYQGLKLAADSLSNSGMNITMQVYDTRNSMFTVKRQVGQLKNFKPDLIIGPAFKQYVEHVADAFAEEGVPVVSPLSMSVDVKGRENLMQTIPDKESQLARIADILNQKFQNARVLFVHSGKPSELQQVQSINARLKSRNDSSFINNTVVPKSSLASQGQLRSMMNPDGPTAVVVLGEDVVFLNDLVSKLHNLRDSSITLIASPRLLNMSTLENEYLDQLRLTMADVRHTDYSDAKTQEFIRAYREEFQAEPSGFAQQGYDLGLFLLNRLWKSGVYFTNHLAGVEVKTATGYDMQKEEKGGYTNHFLFVTGIRNFELVRIPMEQKSELQPVEIPELEGDVRR